MKSMTNRRTLLKIIASMLGGMFVPAIAQMPMRGGGGGLRGSGQRREGGVTRRGGRRRGPESYVLPQELAAFGALSLILGRISDRGITISALANTPLEGYFEYGRDPGDAFHATNLTTFPLGQPVETVVGNLQSNTEYIYRFHSRKPGETAFSAEREGSFHTQRSPGSSFNFSIQGDSHPERPQMSDPILYARTLLSAMACKPDIHICMGDDFSVDTLHELDQQTIAGRYSLQRPFLGLVAHSAPLFLLNGNHEQASLFNFNQTGTPHDVAVLAQNARNYYFPTAAPDGFYTGDAMSLNSIGPLKDYYSWTWGDALFVMLDNYWHSRTLVDSPLHGDDGGAGNRNQGQGGHNDRDWWELTLGDAQYHWFKQTLEQSQAKYKFVFAHHVLGSGRGGIEWSDLFEWGGRSHRGDWEFTQRRPGWEMPIHQLMVKYGVTIFFQGHDHLFARQERDGVVYQEVPMPADQGYFAYNEDRYLSGTKLPNSGHLRVNVSPERVKVDYVRCYLPRDETPLHKTGKVAFSYTIEPKTRHV